jgi:hypothetical protein
MTETEARALFVNTAKSYLGYSESSGKHRQIIDLYNSRTPLPRNYKVTYTDAWCATFVSACAIKCGMANIIPRECSCFYQVEQFQKMERWQENDGYIPKPGDIIYYDWQDNGKGDDTGVPDHVGIVESVSGGVITVIEGNKNDSVERRKIAVDGTCIRGYGLPNFAWWASEHTPKQKDPWYVTDGTWQEGTRLGIVDGNRPTAQATRAEVNKMILTAMRLMKEGK